MKLIIMISILVLNQQVAFASAAPDSPGIEVDCEYNATLLKAKGKGKPEIDLRIVSMPALKLSGTVVKLRFGGMTSQCKEIYTGQIDELTHVGTCLDDGLEEPLKIEKIDIMKIDSKDKSKMDYECKKKNSPAKALSPNSTAK